MPITAHNPIDRCAQSGPRPPPGLWYCTVREVGPRTTYVELHKRGPVSRRPLRSEVTAECSAAGPICHVLAPMRRDVSQGSVIDMPDAGVHVLGGRAGLRAAPGPGGRLSECEEIRRGPAFVREDVKSIKAWLATMPGRGRAAWPGRWQTSS